MRARPGNTLVKTDGDGSRDAVLNRDCLCITLDRPRLDAAIRRQAGDADLVSALLEDRPHLFSGGPVFLSARDIEAMMAVVGAIEAAARTPAYQEAVLAWAPAIARRDFGPRGVFMGYDFHLGGDGPRLIEVNTNAGGAFLNAFLARAQGVCCREARDAMRAGAAGDFEALVWRMFLDEWALQGRSGQPRTIIILPLLFSTDRTARVFGGLVALVLAITVTFFQWSYISVSASEARRRPCI